jgi:RNA polymerase sigma-70 factor (ECF subfamily)
MKPADEDAELMMRYRDGDVSAFEILYRRHNDPLYRYLLRLSRNRDTAADVFQEAWGKIIKSRHAYRPTARFSTFLYRVAHNCFIDHIRRNKRHLVAVDSDPDDHASPVDSPEHCAEKTIAGERLRVALIELPDDQRNVFLLHAEAGLSIDSIAEVTGVNRETAKTRLRSPMYNLKIKLRDSPARSETIA